MKLFECGIRYDKMMENGMQKKVTELYIVDALTFGEAESRVIEEMSYYVDGKMEVVSEKITKYSELVETDGADKWYKAKVNIITMDENSGADKKQAMFYLIRASDIDHARQRLNEFMQGTVADWECEALQETKIVDVFLNDMSDRGGRADKPDRSKPKEAAIASSPSFKRAVKNYIDSIPDGQKVTISAPGCKDVVIDKTHGHEKQDDA